MNQQQLNAIKARAEAAQYAEGSPSIEKVKAMALFRHNAVSDVLALVAEVERLRVEVDQAERQSLDHYVGREELRAEAEALKAKSSQLQLELDSSNEAIDELIFPDFGDD